jgi:hypothetical protein
MMDRSSGYVQGQEPTKPGPWTHPHALELQGKAEPLSVSCCAPLIRPAVFPGTGWHPALTCPRRMNPVLDPGAPSDLAQLGTSHRRRGHWAPSPPRSPTGDDLDRRTVLRASVGRPVEARRVSTPGAGLGARSCRQDITRGPASASRGSRLRGARTRAPYSASPPGLSRTVSPSQRGSAHHRPRSHAPGTFGRPPGGAAGWVRPIEPAACTYPGRRWSAPAGARSPRHLDDFEPSHRAGLSDRTRPAGTAVPAGWVSAQASRAMKPQMVTAAKQRTMAGSSPAPTWAGRR